MSVHATRSPSASERWFNCPGTINHCGGRLSPDTDASIEGTFGHAIAADALQTGRELDTYLGQRPTTIETGVNIPSLVVDRDMVAALAVYVDFARELYMLHAGRWWIEQRVTAFAAVSGTADLMVLSDDGTELWVVDLKFGAGVFVEVEANSQLRLYGLGALYTHAKLTDNVRTVHICVVQPRHYQGPPVRVETLTREQLVDWSRIAMEHERRTHAKDAPLVPGDWCKFCPGQVDCPALKAKALDVAKDVFAGGDLTAPAKPPAPAAMTTEQLARTLAAFPILEAWMKSVRAHALESAKRGVELPGWKLTQGLGNRRWASEPTAVATLKRLGIDPYERKLITPAEAERRGAKLDTKLTVRAETSLALVPADNPRPAIKARAGDVFRKAPKT